MVIWAHGPRAERTAVSSVNEFGSERSTTKGGSRTTRRDSNESALERISRKSKQTANRRANCARSVVARNRPGENLLDAGRGLGRRMRPLFGRLGVLGMELKDRLVGVERPRGEGGAGGEGRRDREEPEESESALQGMSPTLIFRRIPSIILHVMGSRARLDFRNCRPRYPRCCSQMSSPLRRG